MPRTTRKKQRRRRAITLRSGDKIHLEANGRSTVRIYYPPAVDVKFIKRD